MKRTILTTTKTRNLVFVLHPTPHPLTQPKSLARERELVLVKLRF